MRESELGVAQLADLIARRELSPLEVAKASIARFEETEPLLNAFISLDRDRVLADAARLDGEARRGEVRGPLHGVPIAVKDNICTRAERTTAGSVVYGAHVPDRDATVVERLRSAGALIFGKTNLPEFAYGPADAYHYGPTRNPWDPDRYAGGSSMGSGAAVAAGVVAGALGTDTTGSIRNPATWCGVVGFKPSYGLVPLRGVLPLATSFDHVGPLARSAEDCASILSVIAGVDHADPTSEAFPRVDYVAQLGRPIAGLRVGVVPQLWEALGPSVSRPLCRALQDLRQLGIDLVGVDIGYWDAVVEAGAVLVECEAAVEYRTIVEQSGSRLLPEVEGRLRAGLATPAPALVDALRVARMFRHQYRNAMRDVDLLVLPGHERTAPRIDPSGRRLDPSTTLRMVMPMNVVGAPAVTMPAGVVDGLPISLLLAGGIGSEALLLAVASAFQRITDWHRRRPPRLTNTTEKE
ncbi:amidase [Mycobacterium sp. URHB0044]|uniref:amidase n=1 Tax=Mycobacterium sp. URHB0044 TaxID=1380386 RepID=UPI00048D30C9|nr:amidase [Mycobacterium sp. URHB0044]